jgi:hypothetical protein
VIVERLGGATEGIKATKGHRASLTACQRSSGLPPVSDVSGTVRYKGKALGGGTIPFLGSDGAASPATIGAEGTYHTRVRVGEARVLVSCVDEGRMVEHLQKLSDFTRGAKAGAAPESRSFSLISERYGAWSTSGLKVTIQGGKNTHDFDLP